MTLATFLFGNRRASSVTGYHPSKNPPQWIGTAGTLTASGASVNDEVALKWSAVWCSFVAFSNGVAMTPLHVYRKLNDDEREKADDHPVYQLLNRKPNALMIPFEIKARMVWDALHGVHLSQKVYNRGGELVELRPLSIGRVRILKDPGVEDDRDLGIIYKYQPLKGENLYFGPDEILHINGIDSDGITGRNLIDVARETIGTALAQEGYQADFYKNSAMPLGLLEYPEALEDDEIHRIRKSWKRQHGDQGNRHNVAVLEKGMKFTALAITPEQSQFVESQAFTLENWARFAGIPLHRLQHMAKASDATIEQKDLEWLGDCLGPWFCRIQESINRCLLADEPDLYAEFLVANQVRADIATRYKVYNTGIMGGFMTRAEARKKENLPWIDGLDEPLTPLNMGEQGNSGDKTGPQTHRPADSMMTDEENQKDEGRDAGVIREAFRRIFEAECASLRHRESKEVLRLIKREKFTKDIQTFYEGFGATVERSLQVVAQAFVDASGIQAAPDMAACLADIANRFTDTSKLVIRDALPQKSYRLILESYFSGIYENGPTDADRILKRLEGGTHNA